MAEMAVDDRLHDLPPSAKLVHLVLDHEGPLTQAELTEQTTLPNRTVRYAVERLEAEDLVSKQTYMQDARQSLYSVK